MENTKLDLQTDYLLSKFVFDSDLSAGLDGEISHDKITRFLSNQMYTSKAAMVEGQANSKDS